MDLLGQADALLSLGIALFGLAVGWAITVVHLG